MSKNSSKGHAVLLKKEDAKRRKQIDDKNLSLWVLFGILCLMGMIFLFWKAQYGYGNRDEAFYMTIPKRLCQGDALLSEEWHVSQLSAFLLYPLMKIYMLFNPSFEGAVLHFRVFYILFQVICAVWIFYRMKRLSRPVALIASLFFMLYAPFNIMALSYNSLGIGFFALATVTYVSTPADASRRCYFVNMALAGLFFACTVLCCPYLAALYFFYLLAVGVASLVGRLQKKPFADTHPLSWMTLLGFTVGVAVMALLFLVFVLSRSSLSQILDSVSQIMNDPEHSAFSLTYTLKKFGKSIINSNSYAIWCYPAIGVLAFAACLDRKSYVRKTVYFILAAALTVTYALGFLEKPYINYLMMPLNLLGLVSFFLCEKRPWKVFLAMFCPTLLYAYAVCSSSNQQFYVISSVFSVGCICSLYFIYRFLSVYPQRKVTLLRIATQAVGILAFGVICVFAMQIRSTATFWDKDVGELDVKIEEGINRGVITREYYKNKDEQERRDTEEVRAIPEGNVLYLSQNTGLYLLDQKNSAAFSAWMSLGTMTKPYLKQAISRLNEYYRQNPHKAPDVIFFDISSKPDAEYAKELLGLEGTLQKSGNGYILDCR